MKIVFKLCLMGIGQGKTYGRSSGIIDRAELSRDMRLEQSNIRVYACSHLWPMQVLQRQKNKHCGSKRTKKNKHCGSKRYKRYDSTGLLSDKQQLIYRYCTRVMEYIPTGLTISRGVASSPQHCILFVNNLYTCKYFYFNF